MAGAQPLLKPEVIEAELVDEASTADEYTPRVRELSTLPQIRAEMARVYREARRGDLQTSEASRFIYMLDRMTKNLETQVQQRMLANVDTPAFVGLVLQIGKSE